MILFLTRAFQLRLRLGWKPELTGFLIGDRNHYFFTPETLVEAPVITPQTIDQFLSRQSIGAPWELLGFLAPAEIEPITGYVQVVTSSHADPMKWTATIHLPEPSLDAPVKLQIRIAGIEKSQEQR